MIRWKLLIPLLAASAAPVLADEPTLGPIIESYGPTHLVAESDVALPSGFRYKVVFDVAADPESNAVNRNLVSVARFLNMHARHGVPQHNMDVAIVIHGRATANLLRNEGYRLRRATDNPNLELIDALQAAGVSIYACGQSLAYAGISKDALIDGVKVALSAMTMLTVLQSEGYALLPWGAN
jgi:intracellular sulfur oxidation DsrE/DsrF family protein